MGNFEKLGVLVIIILAVVIMIILIGGGPQEPLQPDEGKEPTILDHNTGRNPGGGDPGRLPEPSPGSGQDLPVPADPAWPPPPPGVDPLPDDPPVLPPVVEPDPDPVVTDLRHTVQRGDTLYQIAKLHYGDGKYYREIQQANPGLTPSNLPVGKQIRIPHPSKILGASARAPAAPSPAVDGGLYVVQKGDSLWSIAVKTMGSGPAYRKIHEANRDLLGPDGNMLSPGMQLRIPR